MHSWQLKGVATHGRLWRWGGVGEVSLLSIPDALAGPWELLEKCLHVGAGGTFLMPTHLLPHVGTYTHDSP